ncbi:MAG: putative baseplate assembly protein, partial [bacterium]|nr:putative baseplate assembly protein [bacterium]
VQGENLEWEQWERVGDFESSGPDDPHYLFNPDGGKITFGNGLNGRVPQKSRRIRASYQTTLGAKGNILDNRDFTVTGVDHYSGLNLHPASGGKDAETLAQAKILARKDLKARYRAVTSDDYEELTKNSPGVKVARVKVLPQYDPHFPCISVPGAVTVVVVPRVRAGTVKAVPGEEFLRTLHRFLDRRRLVTTHLHVIGPEYVDVSVFCKIKLKKKSSPANVKERVLEKLKEFLDPLTGGPGKNGWPFGRSVYPSEIYQLIDNVEGVDYAAGISLQSRGIIYRSGQPVEIPPTALVFSGSHQVEIIP